MLQVAAIEAKKAQFIEGLHKRGIRNADELLSEVISLDNDRKKTQQQLDDTKAKANQLAKSIGQLYKEGKQSEASAAKEESAQLKEQSKQLGEEMARIESLLLEKLYNIPNVPHELVPAGNTDEDNEVIKTVDDQLPDLHAKAKPHWD